MYSPLNDLFKTTYGLHNNLNKQYFGPYKVKLEYYEIIKCLIHPSLDPDFMKIIFSTLCLTHTSHCLLMHQYQASLVLGTSRLPHFQPSWLVIELPFLENLLWRNTFHRCFPLSRRPAALFFCFLTYTYQN